MTKTQRRILLFIQIFLVSFAGVLFARQLIDPSFNKLAGVLASVILPFIPQFFQKIFKCEVYFHFQIIYFIFLFASLFLGIDLDFYRVVPHYDKVVHFASGVLTVIVGWYTLFFFGSDKNTNKSLQNVFIFCFCATVAVLWEFFEFGCDKLLGQNMQQLVQHGVDDTMFDLLFACIGAVIGIAVLNLINKHRNRKSQK